ncbi:hypothetical protein M2347_002943 [Chryseobacterium sp. H1D6B]|uniref:Pr6Pr family membrane protein n=1 Tax=Chryseobacterium sp. H1D6B TaxID=2940588 RepID=UPI0015C6A63D|nr:Pr6Pr family membrane protein [Chryseobacterium sp. H1D6B]MDH6253216.1 hypothetical protein [Chryseobacterium sp. H1D6B]
MNTKRILALIFSLLGWFALAAQYYLMLQSRETTTIEITINYFSYFTILTNLLVAVYFTREVFTINSIKSRSSGRLTAITIYILVVGIIYQLLLRSGELTGMQWTANELLHSLIPVFTLIYWYLYEDKKNLTYQLIPKWTIYPLLYLVYILIRGTISGSYPYPFINVADLGIAKALMNAFWIAVFFIVLSVIFVKIGKLIDK